MVIVQCLITLASPWNPRGRPLKLLKLTFRDIMVALLSFQVYGSLWVTWLSPITPCAFLKGTLCSSCFHPFMPLPTPRHPSNMCCFYPVPTRTPPPPGSRHWSPQEVTPPSSTLPRSSLPSGLCFLLDRASCTGGGTSNSLSGYKTFLAVDFVLFIYGPVFEEKHCFESYYQLSGQTELDKVFLSP